MARNQVPASEEEIEALREEMDDQREDIREALAEDLSGEPRTTTPKSTSTTALASLWPMAANRPVSDDEFDQLPGRTSNHFDRVRDHLEQETDDSDA